MRKSSFSIRAVGGKGIGEELHLSKRSLEGLFLWNSRVTFKDLSPAKTIFGVLV